MFLLAAGLLFAIYFANVILGASGNASFMGDVSEMLVLFASSICFTVAILRAEKKKKNKS
ncbi:hypothetical protein GQ651_17795 [Alphaproteobacteria bacterium GH1-50]|uniref:Uncharacterized protein n=1 Tax=Kangsaoukella pontilimi TaxID=2691042 RepID=A0A7C9IKL9_9RHOB|nr:hypothetical protein [Kangsaoukella pontilimi]MXQ09702.1 hypothetical protein [Kangsaoukella pontilimi]